MNAKGFSLIELMIVVGVLALLASITIPAFQQFAVRARVTEGLSLAYTAEIAINDYVANNSVLPNTQAATSYTSPNPTNNVSSITISAGGVINITYTVLAGNGTILITPSLTSNGGLVWDCTGGTLVAQYRPQSCRP